jgi:hypothetical protein
MSWTAPTIAEFKAFFVRDFPYAPSGDEGNLEYILDADITKAIAEGQINFNEDLFATEAQATLAFMYLAACLLVTNILNSSNGLSAQAKFAIQAASVDGVSQSFAIPEDFLKDSSFSIYAGNAYGVKYLSLVIPLCIGNITITQGYTTP